MKMKLTGFLMLALMMTLGASLLAAQDNDDSKAKSDTRTITGCLSQGDSANEFVLTANDGSTWEVRSSSVPLANHVGHTVSAVGAVNNSTAHNLKEDAKDAAHDTGMKKDNTEHGHLTVTDVTMVSDSCNK
jgi:ABC-type sugar transport system substrate-binding protein